MAADPRIALGVTPTNVQNTFSNALTNIDSLNRVNAFEAAQPLQQQLLEQKVESFVARLRFVMLLLRQNYPLSRQLYR